MGRCGVSFLLVTSCLVLTLAYVMYSPIPPGLPAKARLLVGFSHLIKATSKAAGHLGWDRGLVFRQLISYVAGLKSKPEEPPFLAQDLVFDGVTVHMITPDNTQSPPRRAVVYFHGGGWVIGDLHMYYPVLHRISIDLNAVVLYVEYRMAPEHVFPAAIDDCEKATQYFMKHATEYGVDPRRIVIMGDSAGGNMASTLSYRIKKNGHMMPKLQVLIYPMISSLNFDSPSYRANHMGPMVTRDLFVYHPLVYLFGTDAMNYYNSLYTNNHTSPAAKKQLANSFLNLKYLPKDEFMNGYIEKLDYGDEAMWDAIKDQFQDPSFCPLFGGDASGFPRTYISTCQWDILRDEGYFYAAYLREYGVDVTHVNVDPCYHGWFAGFKNLEIFEEEFKKVMKYTDDNL